MPDAPLPTIAEVAITVAGFTSIIFVLRTKIGVQEKQRFLHLLALATLIVICALLPPSIATYSTNPAIMWGIPLFVYGAWSATQSTLAFFSIRKGEISPSTPTLTKVLFVAGNIVGLVGLLAPFSIILEPTHGLLSLVLLYTLIPLIVSFFTALQHIWNTEKE